LAIIGNTVGHKWNVSSSSIIGITVGHKWNESSSSIIGITVGHKGLAARECSLPRSKRVIASSLAPPPPPQVGNHWQHGCSKDW
jgi:hypothetical protein